MSGSLNCPSRASGSFKESNDRAGGRKGVPQPSVAPRHDLPSVTVDRLVRCHRLCARLGAEGRDFISSREIGSALGCSPSQVRKDLSRLGRFGTRGSGYRIEELQGMLGRLLGKDRRWNVVLVGAGNLGTALVRHGEFRRRGFRFVAVFDADPGKVGRKIGGLVVQDVSRIGRVLRSSDAKIGVVAVPAEGAHKAARLLEENGVRAILNFAPAALMPGGDAVVSNVDLAIELEKLCYCLTPTILPRHTRQNGRAGER